MSTAFNIPAGWREAIAEIRSGLNDATPSAFDNSGYRDYASVVLDAVEEELSALAAAPPVDAVPGESVAPIDMVLFCPACRLQHIDAPWTPGATLTNDQIKGTEPIWNNPPHRSHLCHGCDHVWRPADVMTNGVAAVKTIGSADSPLAASVASRAGMEPVAKLIGWRTDDYLMETGDPKMAKNWEVHHKMLPIFEGDSHTKLAPIAPEAPAEAKDAVRAEPVASNGYCITFNDPRDFCRFASILIGAVYQSESDALKRFENGTLFGEKTWGKVSASAISAPTTLRQPEAAEGGQA